MLNSAASRTTPSDRDNPAKHKSIALRVSSRIRPSFKPAHQSFTTKINELFVLQVTYLSDRLRFFWATLSPRASQRHNPHFHTRNYAIEERPFPLDKGMHCYLRISV
jgi:hypothetical protein